MRSATTAGALAAAAWSLPALAPLEPRLARAMGVARSTQGGTVALTFDDGPHARGTPAVLDALARGGAVATFFLVGEQVRRAPALAAEIAAAGHAVAVHGFRHRVLLRVPPAAAADDLDRAAEAIHAATGVVPRVHRPPLGIYSWPALGAVRARDWTPTLWSRWGRDWRADATPASVATRVAAGLHGGEVLLLHDADHYSAPGCWRATAGAVPRVLEAVSARGLRTVALGR